MLPSLSLVSVKSRLVLPFWYRLTWIVPDKEPFNDVCVCVCVCVVLLHDKGGQCYAFVDRLMLCEALNKVCESLDDDDVMTAWLWWLLSCSVVYFIFNLNTV